MGEGWIVGPELPPWFKEAFDEDLFRGLLDNLFRIGKQLDWHRIPAKAQLRTQTGEMKVYVEQSLLMHSLNACAAAFRLIKFLVEQRAIKLDEDLRPSDVGFILASSFLHDVGKTEGILRHRERTSPEIIHEFLEKFGFLEYFKSSKIGDVSSLQSSLGNIVFVQTKEHQIPTTGVLREISEGKVGEKGVLTLVRNFVVLADLLASLRDPSNIREANEYLRRITGKPEYIFTYHKVNALHGILTNLLHSSIEGCLEKAFSSRIEPIILLPDTTFYIYGQDNSDKSIDSSQLKENIYHSLMQLISGIVREQSKRKSCALISPNPRFYAWADPLLAYYWGLEAYVTRVFEMFQDRSRRAIAATRDVNERKLGKKLQSVGMDLKPSYEVVILGRFLGWFIRSILANSERYSSSKHDDVTKRIYDELGKYLGVSTQHINVILSQKELGSDLLAAAIFEVRIKGKTIRSLKDPLEVVKKIINDFVKELSKDEPTLTETLVREGLSISRSEFENEFKKNIVRIIQLDPSIFREELGVDFSPNSYAFSKAGSTTSEKKSEFSCMNCNTGGMGFALRVTRVGLETKVFTNRNVAGQRIEVRWICASCFIESFLRTLFMPEGWGRDEKDIYHFIMPDILFARDISNKLHRLIGRIIGSEPANIPLWNFASRLLAEEYYGSENEYLLFEKAGYRRFVWFPTPISNPHFLMFVTRYQPEDNEPVADSRIWFESLFTGVLLQDSFAVKDVITTSFTPSVSLPVRTIELESPHMMVRKLLEFSTGRVGRDAWRLKLEEIDWISKVVASVYHAARVRHDKLNKVPNVLDVIYNYFMPGSKIFHEVASDERKVGISKSKDFVVSCQTLDKLKRGMMYAR